MPTIIMFHQGDMLTEHFNMTAKKPRWSVRAGWNVISTGHDREILLGFEYENDYMRLNNDCPKLGFKSPLELEKAVKKNITKFGPIGADCGCEYRSFVAPLSLHKTLLPKYGFFDRPFNTKSSLRNSGGIHVNINKTKYTDAAYPKVARFLHDYDNKKQLIYLSGRAVQHFERNNLQFGNPLKGQMPKGSIDNYVHLGGWLCGNYYNKDYTRTPALRNETREEYFKRLYDPAAAGQGHHSTIWLNESSRWEHRLFHAKPDLLFPALEFVDSLYRHSHSLEQTEEISWDSWYAYILRKPVYTHIRERYEKVVKYMGNLSSRRQPQPEAAPGQRSAA